MDSQRTVLGLTAAALGIGLVARKCYAAPAAATTEAAEPSTAVAPLAGRTAHWVIRCTDLKPFLQFASEVFGMKVIRHEENSEPCDIACNGRYNNAWSKTMVGYNDEAFAYCLEVAYNYGVRCARPAPCARAHGLHRACLARVAASGLRADELTGGPCWCRGQVYEYEPGNALLSIGIAVPDVAKALGAATKLGYTVEGATVLGPDGYKYEVSELADDRAEPFQFVKTVVSDVAASKAFYTDTMGMADLSTGAHVLVGSSGTQVPLILEQGAVDWQEYSGRHAISIPERELLGAENAFFEPFSYLIMKNPINLPRQARDQHRKS